MYYIRLRATGRSENMGVPLLLGGHNLPLLVEIGLTDLPAMAPTALKPLRPMLQQPTFITE